VIARALHHVSFAVRDLERSRRFYEGVLGLEPIPRPPLGVQGIWYAVGGCQLHLIVTPPGAEVGTPPSRITPIANHSAFSIDDYSGVLAQLEARGIEVLPTSAERGQMWVRDPDGNVLELIAEASPR
jgi:catechol 2,3-dioxygenase-like lactoylglutathione lyase family enzyme